MSYYKTDPDGGKDEYPNPLPLPPGLSYAVDLIKETYSTLLQEISKKLPPQAMRKYLAFRDELGVRSEWLATLAVAKAAELQVTEPIGAKEAIEDMLRRFKDT